MWGAERHGGLCWLCGGEMVAGKPATLPQTFMDYDKARCPDSGYICDACWFSMAEQSELLAERVGKWWPTDADAHSMGGWPCSSGSIQSCGTSLQESSQRCGDSVSGWPKEVVCHANQA